ncbi:hypothetical protein CMV_008547 [Castanea mollissima]|uniref:Aminotransferase-like plant mobile domain-containing protein n=1 Tax=Castanea mollissima TaxID=60419 RepID=A0A8J4RFZ9_9ROSI|nr:hypothetical protein CMV_008547 [Castanea mollissima]
MEPGIDEEPEIVRPGPEDPSLLTRQRNHRSEDIWNGEDSGSLTCRGRAKEMAKITMQDNRKSRPSGMALIHYREQLVRMQPDQIIWQPYEADFGHLPDFCVAGRDTWTARVPLTGEMPRNHDYYRWYRSVTRKYVDRNSAKLDIMIESHLALLEMLPDTKAALCTMMSLRMMPHSLLPPRPNIT